MMHYYGYGHGAFFGPGFGIFGSLSSILFWILIIGLIVYLLRNSFHSEEDNSVKKSVEQKNDNNLEIIKKRYAEGEIDKKEYEQLKRDLS